MDVKPKSRISKWFSPVVFLFLICACPPIWIMELSIASNTTVKFEKINTTALNTVIPRFHTSPLPTTLQSINIPQITTTIEPTFNVSETNLVTEQQELVTDYNDTIVTTSDVDNNMTTAIPDELSNGTSESTSFLKTPEITTTSMNILTNTDYFIYENGTQQDAIEKKGADVLKKIESIWGYLDIPYRTTILEQVLLLTLIICRWLLPREGISRNQLSQLLLVNIGMAADILELFEALKETVVRHHLLLNMIILTLWQASLFQFSLTKTVTKARKVRVGFFEEYPLKSIAESKLAITNCICCRTELWAIATSLLLQDIPFFCLRITLIVDFDVLSYSNIFFTCKNSLVILLQLFRSYVIISGKGDDNQLDSTLSRQSLVTGNPTRWNQVACNSVGVNANLENRKPLFTDPYELTITSHNNHFQCILPKASPELSISSKEDIPKTESLNSILSINTNEEIV